MGQSFLKNAALLTGADVLLRLAGMGLRSYLANALGGEGRGLYQLVLAVYALFVTLATAGVSVEAKTLITEELARGRAQARGVRERLAGAGYFSGALADALSRTGSFGADENRDGVITLTELRRRLLHSHGASPVRTYPEDSDFALISYDFSAVSSRRREPSIEGITFSGDTLSADAPVIDFSFNVVRTAQVAYQLVYRRQGIWDFDQSTLIYDNNGDFGSYAIAGRTLSPGLKERSITLNTAAAQSSGYVLLQIMVIEKALPSVVWSKVLCVPPTTDDPQLRVHVQDTFCPESGEELTFVVYHGVPCELTVTIEDVAGQTVRRLSSRQASRPEQLSATGSTFC